MKRILAFALSLVMLLGLVPFTRQEAEAGNVKVTDPDTSRAGVYMGTYLVDDLSKDNTISSGYTSAMFVNGALNNAYGNGPSLPQTTMTVVGYFYRNKSISVDKIDGEFSDVKNAQGMSKKVSDYNMMVAFGNDNIAAQKGFDKGGNYANCKTNHKGTLDLARTKDSGDGTGTSTITIADNPSLKALAETGQLEFYFSGKTTYGRDMLGCDKDEPGNYFYTKCYVELWEGDTKVATYYRKGGYSTTNYDYITTGGYVKLTTNSKIKFLIDANKGSGCDDEYPSEGTGFYESVLLFRKATNPDMTGYSLVANGDRYTTESSVAQMLLGENDTMSLSFSFSESVKSGLSDLNNRTVGNGATLMALANRKLFSNTEGTGFVNQGNDVYMKLSSVLDGVGVSHNTYTDDERFNYIKSTLKGITFTWTAGLGDYYGNNPLPNDGDWAGSAPTSNSFCLLDNIVLASFHDLAGNPMTIGGKLIPYSDEGVSGDALTGTITVMDQKQSKIVYQKSGVKNPFKYTKDSTSGFATIIDTVKPTYSKTSNAVQPEILTQLVVNRNDVFLVHLNYSEPVKLRQYYENGTPTNYQAKDLVIEFKNGMTGVYQKGIGTKQLTFEVTVSGDEAKNVVGKDNYLELKCLRLADSAGAKKLTFNSTKSVTDYILTDYVGNILVEELGINDGNVMTHMAWSKLTVDNEKPKISLSQVTTDSAFGFTVNITDNASYAYNDKENYSGVFHISNTTSGNDVKSGIFYYAWVEDSGVEPEAGKLDQNLQTAIDLFTADNYMLVKKASLGVSIAAELEGTGLSLKVKNNGETIMAPEESKNGNTWYLLVFAGDMTWDSARQLIQYSRASWDVYPDAYYDILIQQLGINPAEMFIKIETEPQTTAGSFDFDWDVNQGYSHYYYKVGGDYQKISKGGFYPALAAVDSDNKGIQYTTDTYYQYQYTVLDDNGRPTDWDDTYTGYYYDRSTTATAKYTKNPLVSSTPDFVTPVYVSGTTAAADNGYVLLSAQPADWNENYGAYYTDSFQSVGAIDPSFGDGTYFKKTSDVSFYTDGENYYQKLTEAPASWSDVYKQDASGAFVLATTPPFIADTYYRKSASYKTGYVKLANQPADWGTNWNDYYMQAGGKFVSNTSKVFTANTYYVRRAGFTVLTAEPADWAENYSRYFTNTSGNVFAPVSGTSAPKFSGTTYYELNMVDTYYTMYELDTAETDANFTLENFGEYATRTDDGSYETVLESLTPTYRDNVFYSLKGTGSQLLSEKPVDWSINYSHYYTDKACTKKVQATDNHAPAFSANVYYVKADVNYTVLTEKPEYWNILYKTYYQKDGDQYVIVSDTTAPVFAKDTYYEQKTTATALTSQPAAWKTTFQNYYTRSETVYHNVKEQAPAFTTVYKISKDTGNVTMVSSKPADWADNFGQYYLDSKMVTVADAALRAPAFRENTYYSLNGDTYVLLTAEPADWETNYGAYFMQIAENVYTAAVSTYAPVFQRRTYYKCTGSIYTLLTAEPADWETNFKGYYTRQNKSSAAKVQGVYTPANETAVFAENTYYVADDSTYKLVTSGEGFNPTENIYYTLGAPAFAANAYYQLIGNEYIPVTEQPEEWATKYGAYYTVSFAQVAGTAPKWDANKYLSAEYTQLTLAGTQVQGKSTSYTWSRSFSQFYTEAGNAESRMLNYVPPFIKNTYYSTSTGSYVLLSSKPSDWDTNYADYYVKRGEDIYLAVTAVPTFASSDYFELTVAKVSSNTNDEPENWENDFDTAYVWMEPYVYTSILDQLDENRLPVYTANTYYKLLDEAQVLTSQPSDWSTAYRYYFYEDLTPVMKQKTVDYTANKYYEMQPVALKAVVDLDSKIDLSKVTDKELAAQLKRIEAGEQDTLEFPYVSLKDWIQTYGNYYVKQGSSYLQIGDLNEKRTAYALVGSTATIAAKENIPSFDKNYYKDPDSHEVYRASEAFATLAASKKMDAVRTEEFINDMLSAASSKNEQIPILRGYWELANEVLVADAEIMKNAAQYSTWSDSDFSNDDSNWTYFYGSTKLDKEPPVVTMGEAGVTDDNTGNAKVAVEVEDSFSLINEVTFKFIPADTAIEDNAQTWAAAFTKSTGTETRSVELTVNIADYLKACVLDDGKYDLYVKAKDDQGNEETYKIATVNLSTYCDVTCAVNVPTTLTSPYEKLSGLTVSITGTAMNQNVQDMALKVCAAFDQMPVKKAGETGWSDLLTEKDNAGNYVLPEFGPVNGTYYLHIMYAYDAVGGSDNWHYYDTMYTMKGLITDIAIIQTGMEEGYLTVEFEPDGKADLYYQMMTDLETELTVDSDGWNAVTAEEGKPLSVKLDVGTAKTVRIWVKDKNNTVIRSNIFSVIAKPLSDENAEAPTVSPALLDVYQDNGNYYAIVKLSTTLSKLSASTEYSMAVTTPTTAMEDVSWQRWRPFESIVRVKLGASTENVQLMFKFRSGSDVTDEEDYLSIYDFSKPTGEPWAIVNRATYQDVGPAGLGLTFVTKDGVSMDNGTAVTEKANGLYTYSFTCTDMNSSFHGICDNLAVIINNVDTTPPAFTLEWADGGVHTQTSNPVRVTLRFDEDVRITKAVFVKEGETTESNIRKESTYLFTENGTATFTFTDAMGNENRASARVTWIENQFPEFNIVQDYSGYAVLAEGQTIVAASGVRLKLESKKGVFKDDVYVRDGTNDRDEFYLDVTKNGTYSFTLSDTAGHYVSKSITVSNVGVTLAAPQVTDMKMEEGKVVVTLTGKVDTKLIAGGYELYDGTAPVDGNKITVNSITGEYTMEKKFFSNGNVRAAICDNLGSVTYYDIAVNGKDETAPLIIVPDGVMQMTLGETLDTAWWMKHVTISDTNAKGENNPNFTIKWVVGNEVNKQLTNRGAYSVRLEVTDDSGNTSTQLVTIYVIPTGGLIVMSDKGVLFSASSTDTALINDKTIRLTIRNFDEMIYDDNGTKKTVRNKAATYELILQQGLFREGQMKYFETRLKNLTFTDPENHLGTVLLDTDKLPGTGWYTIIVRTAERDREYTTFFYNP